MAVRNRELSQFGSFIYVDNSSQEIGIATEAVPYVGIGTANPEYKLHVVGSTNIQGNFYINGQLATSVSTQVWDTVGSNAYRLTGNVGIGTSVPVQKLDVNGNIRGSQIISTVSTGTAPFSVNSTTQVTFLNASLLGGKSAPSGNIVGDTDTQTLTNKTLTSPILTSPIISSGGIGVTGGIIFYGSTSGSTTLQASTIASGTLTLPSTTDTLVARNTTETLTNKTISASSNTITGLTNSNLSASAGILTTQLANSTISGVSLGNNLRDLTAGNFITYSSGSTYNGSNPITIGVANITTNNANPASTIVARDTNGDFTAGTISASTFSATSSGYRINTTTVIDINRNLLNVVNGSFSGIVTCTDLNSTSDVKLKENIQTVKNSLATINSLRGVTFDWKENHKPSIGVIAQELEKVLPQLVNDGEIKSVNYNGLIGVLIESVKELSAEVQELKSQLNK